MSKVVKGVKKVFKKAAKVVRSIGREVKRFFKSDLGKVLLAGAAIFAGGVAMGFWGGPTWLGGAGATAGANATVASVGQTAAITAADTAALSGASGVLGTGVTGAGAAGAADLAALSQASSVIGASAAPAATTVAGGVGAGGAASSGLINSALSSVPGSAPAGAAPAGAVNPITAGASTAADAAALGETVAGGVGAGAGTNTAAGIIGKIRSLGKFAQNNQLLTATAVNSLASAFTPSEAELIEEAEKRDQRRRNRNLAVGDLQVSGRVSDEPLRNLRGQPIRSESGGLINRRAFG